MFAGLSGSTKYTGVLGLLTLLVILYAYRKASFIKEALIAVGATAAAFVLATPGVLLDNERFMHDFTYEMQHTSQGHGLVFEGTANGFLFHLLNLFQGFGTIVTSWWAAPRWCMRRTGGRVWAPASACVHAALLLHHRAGRGQVHSVYVPPVRRSLRLGLAGLFRKGHEKKVKWGMGLPPRRAFWRSEAWILAGLMGTGSGYRVHGRRGSSGCRREVPVKRCERRANQTVWLVFLEKPLVLVGAVASG